MVVSAFCGRGEFCHGNYILKVHKHIHTYLKERGGIGPGLDEKVDHQEKKLNFEGRTRLAT